MNFITRNRTTKKKRRKFIFKIKLFFFISLVYYFTKQFGHLYLYFCFEQMRHNSSLLELLLKLLGEVLETEEGRELKLSSV